MSKPSTPKKATPKNKPAPVKINPAKVTLSVEYTERVKKLTNLTGLSMQAIVQSLIEVPLKRLEEGATLVINPSTGGISLGAPPPTFGGASVPSVAPPPVWGGGMVATEDLVGRHRGRPGASEGRKVDMGGE